MDRLNFNHLYYFYIVTKEGSIKDAAEKLHVSQPTISDQIRLLEEYFDCKLFDRRNRGLHLTAEGILAERYCERIFDLSNEVTTRLRNKLELPKKTLDIGITQFMSQYFLYDSVMPLFEQDEVSIRFQENQRHLLLADLEEGNLDIVFTDNKDGIGPSMASYRIGLNRTFAVGHKSFKKYRTGFPDSLNLIPFFNYTADSSLKYEIELFFSRTGLRPKVIGEADDIDLLELVTKRGLAFTIVPESSQKRFCQDKDVVILGELKELQTAVYAVMRKSYRGLGYSLVDGLT